MQLPFVLLAIATVFGSAPSLAATELAKINDVVITLEEFEKKYSENARFFQARPPNKKTVLDDLIKREIAVQAARNAGIDKDPEVEERVKTLLYQALLEKNLAKDVEKIHISDEEAKEYFEKHPEIRTSHIFVAVAPDGGKEADAASLARIRKIRDQSLKPGKMSFSEVAQKESEGAAAALGGDLDYQGNDRLDPVYYETALKLKNPGKVSDIIRTPFGYHIIRLTAIRPWEDADKAKVKRQLFDVKRTAIFDKYMVKLKAAAKITINQALLKD